MDIIAQTTVTSIYEDYWIYIAQFLDSLLIYGESIAIVAAVWFGFRYMLVKYLKPLRVILSPLGMRRVHRVWLSILVWRSSNINSFRAFIERSCIESEGKVQNRRWWRTRIRQYSNRTSDFVIVVDNCFDLRQSDLNDVIQTYFDYYRGDLGSSDETLQFVSQIKIREGYLAPMSFITGLQSRFGEQWQRILRNYTSVLLDLHDEHPYDIIPSELYFFYGWLMWGPSYQSYIDRRSNDGSKTYLMLYGYGDEANSVNIIVDPEVQSDALWSKLSSSASQGSNFGFYCSIVGRLVASYDSGASLESIDSQSLPFYSRMIHSSEVPFALQLTSYVDTYEGNSSSCFFSAYLWIMFSLDPVTFTPHNSLSFFEHANLPDVNNYHFLANRLIDKVFSHFKIISSQPEYQDRKYYYCLSFNSFIYSLFETRLNSVKYGGGAFGDWVSRNLVCQRDSFTIQQVLDSIDDYFKVNNFSLLTDRHCDLKALSDYFVDYVYSSGGQCSLDGCSVDRVVSLLRDPQSDYLVYGYWQQEETLLGYSVCHLDSALGFAVVDYISLSSVSALESREFVVSLILALERELSSLGLGDLVLVRSTSSCCFDPSSYSSYGLTAVAGCSGWLANSSCIDPTRLDRVKSFVSDYNPVF